MDLFKVLGAKPRGIISHVLHIFLSGIVCLLMQLSIITFGMHKHSLDVLHLMLLGLFLGLLSHLILDMCTKDGIYVCGKRVALVPKTDIFKTGSPYEKHLEAFYILCVVFYAFSVLFHKNLYEYVHF